MREPFARPWYVESIDDDEEQCAIIYGGEHASDRIGELQGSDNSWRQDKVNAAHVVKCVNLHDDVLKQLTIIKELALEQYDPTHKVLPDPNKMMFNLGMIFTIADGLLAKAARK